MAVIKSGTAKINQSHANDPLGDFRTELISDTGGLSQFGACVEELAPGAWSSLAHWHAEEDEMVLLLSGQVTLYEDGVATLLAPGDAACWKAGVPLAHRMRNHTDVPARYVVVGTRAPQDKVTYPDQDRVQHLDRDTGTRWFTTLAGDPADAP
ncbi:cupin domain-containing protein [uncultured Roseobacter sp.]|uniref:cupin domain-containing protein n=1 Tax=uncultured Roseobacter sp. TaxID=114847 RepID=UPI002638E4AF|nr:cupin domain-containing protein [uncultured Roseobacter sp.]